MIKPLITALITACLALGSSSCSTEEQFSNKPLEVYDALWRIMDERYAYMELKLPSDSSWRDMYNKYRPELRPQMSNDSLFLVLSKLLGELRDGHVNLTTPFDYGRYWRWWEDYPRNYNSYVADNYLGKDYRLAGGLRYTQLKYNRHEADSIGYLSFSSFSSPLGRSNLNAALSRLAHCKALIIDIRDNGGGNVTTSDLFAQHFTREPRIVGYIRHKTGKGPNDFSSLTPLEIKPVTDGVRWLRPVVLLTNRSVYSAANDFTLKMKDNPFVTVMGDKTGGGGGLPLTSELPNGWSVRYSGAQTLDASKEHIEQGIAPHYNIALDPSDEAQGIDTIIEEAIKYINERYKRLKETKRWEK